MICCIGPSIRWGSSHGSTLPINFLMLEPNYMIQEKHVQKNFPSLLATVCLFVFLLYVPSQQLWSLRDSQFTLPHFFLGRLEQAVNSNSCTYFRLLLTTTILEWISGREENDRRNYFMINLHKSMGPGVDRTQDPWICSQTCICSQTRYQMRYAAWHWLQTH